MTPISPTLDCPCSGAHLTSVFAYDAPPAGEVRFKLDGRYRREYKKCGLCGHFFSSHEIDMAALYEGRYVDATYSDADGLLQSFHRIIDLPPHASDNAARVKRLLAYGASHLASTNPTLLDVGSGLAVFPFAMQAAGWQCTAIDPDQRAAAHAREVAGVEAILGDFLQLPPASIGRFDVVTFNKVLEHVEDPIAMLRRARPLIKEGGFVYVEVPDGESAASEGPGREEFFIDHHHVFSMASLTLMAARAGFEVRQAERLREPSTKYTIWAFLEPSDSVRRA